MGWGLLVFHFAWLQFLFLNWCLILCCPELLKHLGSTTLSLHLSLLLSGTKAQATQLAHVSASSPRCEKQDCGSHERSRSLSSLSLFFHPCWSLPTFAPLLKSGMSILSTVWLSGIYRVHELCSPVIFESLIFLRKLMTLCRATFKLQLQLSKQFFNTGALLSLWSIPQASHSLHQLMLVSKLGCASKIPSLPLYHHC